MRVCAFGLLMSMLKLVQISARWNGPKPETLGTLHFIVGCRCGICLESKPALAGKSYSLLGSLRVRTQRLYEL